jgi:drug/metabolite transporter (DMT)-like permease
VITVKLFKLQWDSKRLFAVILATIGVMAVIYGGSSADADPDTAELAVNIPVLKKYSSPLIGDLLTLVASVGYALYQVLYKRYATLPSDPEHEEGPLYNQILTSEESLSMRQDSVDPEAVGLVPESTVLPPPFGLHPNLLTTLAGLVTLAVLWLPIPVLHYIGAEPFRLPPDFRTVFAIGGVALSGVFFNAGFMVRNDNS